MFKPGEIAGVLESDGRRVTVKETLFSDDGKWEVLTDDGIFSEADLFVAHPSVLATATGRDLNKEVWQAKLATREAPLPTWKPLPEGHLAAIREGLKKMSIHWNGHWKDGNGLRQQYRDHLLEHLYLHRMAFSHEDGVALHTAIESGQPLGRRVPLDIYFEVRDCGYCGAEDFKLTTDGQVLYLTDSPCPFPAGLPPTEWELNVPSGKLVVANDLRRLFPINEDFDVNKTLGRRQTALAYAATGMSHASVGNTCPGVFRCKGDTYKIANEPSEDRWDAATEEWVAVDPPVMFEGERVAGICTDLWWYSMCDHDEFERRCKRFEEDPEQFRADVIDIKPGVYRFRHNEEVDDDAEGERLYAQFDWVRDPDPVQDFLAKYESADVNAHAFVQTQAKHWPTLFGTGRKGTSWAEMSEDQRLQAWYRVADHTLCTIGNGVDWHERGFPHAVVDAGIPDIEPPSFRSQHHWYPFSENYSGLFHKKLAPSFAKLAFRILESVISFGATVQDGAHSRDASFVRERMRTAVKRYRTLAQQYPDLVDLEYVRWLGQEGRAEAWVERFDLGPTITQKHIDHAASQRWIPDDAYAVEFDARKLADGHFVHHPKKMSGWALKEDAQQFAIEAWTDNERPEPHNCFWTCHARDTAIPLYTVARVTKVGEVSHMGNTMVELAFDYGTPWMRGAARKGVSEKEAKPGLRVLTKEEYDRLLPDAVRFFEEVEAQVDGARGLDSPNLNAGS